MSAQELEKPENVAMVALFDEESSSARDPVTDEMAPPAEMPAGDDGPLPTEDDEAPPSA